MQDTDQAAYEDNRSGRAAQGNGKEKINTTQKINFKDREDHRNRKDKGKIKWQR